MSDQFDRRLPVGAEVLPSGGVHFRVWALDRKSVEVMIAGDPPRFIPLTPESGGYFSARVSDASAGTLYKYRLDGTDCFPDPASRYQPHGPHHESEVIDPAAYPWNDGAWPGASLPGQVGYEMHIGTFTPEGVWTAAEQQLPALAELGITFIEVMPVSEFPGRFGWGYDGVHPYAPTHLYGRPEDFKHFVDTAHSLGLAVILDVVYNHLGPDGNYLSKFSPHYFTPKHETDWGEAINFYAEHSGPVREFFIANARYWIEEFHLDGLRLDATQNIYDESKDHIIAAVTREVRSAAGARFTLMIGENEPQDVKLITPPQQGGYGLDALWNDDLHHTAMVALTGRNEGYYSDYFGTPQEFVSALKYGYLYQGQRYDWQDQRRGTPMLGFDPRTMVTFLQNHDQIANSARGLRVHALSDPGRYRALTALVLLGPGTPMLFQGQEFAASAPFLYFADHGPEIAPLVRTGRREFLAQFRSLATADMAHCFADPAESNTFERSKLDLSERASHAEIYALHCDLLRLRRQDPVFSAGAPAALDGAVIAPAAFVLRFFGKDAGDRLLIVNLGRDLVLPSIPEPLLAPPARAQWDVLWSSEDARYGGCGVPPVEAHQGWFLPGHAAVVLTPAKRRRWPKPKPKQDKIKTEI